MIIKEPTTSTNAPPMVHKAKSPHLAKKKFLHDATEHVRDTGHRTFVQKALGGYYKNRNTQKSRFRDWESARDAEEARTIILQLVHNAKAKAIIQSKCMTSEEIHLNAALEKDGYGVVESDLGEFIQQLRASLPIISSFPACMSVARRVSDLFGNFLGTAPTNSPEELLMIARRHMRQLYVDADVGITGANFLVAETGQISITENEGNARLTAALPRVHLSISGIEKVIEHLDDLAVLLPMLATAGAGQQMTCYNTLYAGPRREGECDGPEEMHLVLLDNSRTTILADPKQRDSLHCIRCGACLNVSPIFKNVGGFTYGTTYQGPIGSVITPHLRGLADWNHLSGASSLCGACTDACPVRIDIHHHLLRNRRNAAQTAPSRLEKLGHRLFVIVASRPWLFALGGWLFRRTLEILKVVRPPLLRDWLATRDLPPAPRQSFRAEWAKLLQTNRLATQSWLGSAKPYDCPPRCHT